MLLQVNKWARRMIEKDMREQNGQNGQNPLPHKYLISRDLLPFHKCARRMIVKDRREQDGQNPLPTKYLRIKPFFNIT